VKDHSPSLRASHVNSGTSIPHGDHALPSRTGRVARHPKLHLEATSDPVTPYGGLSLAAGLVKGLGLPSLLDEHLSLLKQYRPFRESDHVLAQTYNLFVGGSCIEDMANLQNSDAVLRMLGACRLPDPTTGGDFLRRFEASDLRSLDEAIDVAQARVWRQLYGGKKQRQAIVDLDSHVRKVYGEQKQGADFSYKGFWAYHPLALTLANTQEVLRLIERPGNVPSAEGAKEALLEVLPMLGRRFEEVIVRGDSAFLDHGLTDAVHEAEHHFAVVMPAYANVRTLAETLSEAAWKPFLPAAQRRRSQRRRQSKRRRRRPNLRRAKALERKKRDLKLKEQWVTEVPYKLARSKHTHRLIIRRQRIDETDRQGRLFEVWRYRFALTNLDEARSASEVIDLTYQRCDQENVIEQLQSGVPALRMPAGDLLANGAFLRCGRLAHNLKSWICQLALPKETVRWKWKRFRQAFVYVAATVVRHARQIWVRLARSHRFHEDLLAAHQRLQT
jgi:hypothetical protein